MKRLAVLALVCITLLFITPQSSFGAVYARQHRYHSYKHRRHLRTARRVGVGAAGGAVIGALAGGGKGAGIGAAAGAGAGYLYDKHKQHQNR